MPDETVETAATAAEPPQPTLPRPVQAALGERLRVMYDSLKAEPVPDRLLALLQEIDQQPSKE